MPISPWYKGDTAPIWTFQLIPDSGAFNITGLSPSNFSLIIRNVDDVPPVDATGTGTFSNLTAATLNGSVVITPASIQYVPSTADVANLGNFQLFVVATYPIAGNPTQTFTVGPWQVIAR
jgi:hypothetical protein